jgi:RimJ/RimL family protein N-acetyltransferase
MILRDTTEDDLPVFFENQRDPEAFGMAAFVPRDQAAFYEHWRTNVLGCAEVQKQTAVVDGAVAGHVVSWTRDGRRLVGYWVGRSYWGRGIASEALREFVAHHEKTRPLYAYVAASNAASIRVLAKCGFRPTGDRTTDADGVEDLLVELR